MEVRKTIVLVGCLALGCNPEVEIKDVILDFALGAETIVADGQSTMKIKVRLPEDASVDRRNVIFKTTGGSFLPSQKNEQTSKATFVDGELVATATLRAPIAPGDFKVSAEIEFNSPSKSYLVEKTIGATLSTAAKLTVDATSTGIGPNAVNEVKITGFLKNAEGKWVSKNTAVVFEDWVGVSPGNGTFRSISNLSSDSSTVAAYYAAAALPPQTVITIVVRTTETGGPSGSIKLIVNQ